MTHNDAFSILHPLLLKCNRNAMVEIFRGYKATHKLELIISHMKTRQIMNGSAIYRLQIKKRSAVDVYRG